MTSASIRHAIQWIAVNDNPGDDHPGNPDAERNVAGYISTLLVADIFNRKPERIAAAVMKIRRDCAARELKLGRRQ